jgi:CubicO group peptidase (beta-lactamase class C family)
MEVRSSTMLLLLLALPAAATLPASSLGPGRGEWQRGRPEDHNLTAPLLEDAARQLQREAPVKECFAVAKDGELLYELDYRREAGKPAPLIESDSAGKTITALLVGVLVTKHSLDLDSTLESHGVRPQADWGPGNKYFPNVTIRHVLSQTSGIGKYEPGEAFTYDSGDYLQHLTALIAAVSGQAPKAWAKESLGVPLGIPELYANDSYTAINPSDDDNITAGGSQFLSCVQMLRFGQLMNNRGWWPDAEGTPTRLISEAYIEQMLTPQYPNAIQNYGLLTWLTTEGPPVRGTGGVTGCCQPQWGCFGHEHLDGGGDVSAADGGRWGALMPGETILSEAALLEAGLPKPRPGLGLAMGWLDKHMLVDPFSNTSIVSFGQTLGGTNLCGERYRQGDGQSKGRWEAGADGAFSASLVWRSVHVLLPRDSYSYGSTSTSTSNSSTSSSSTTSSRSSSSSTSTSSSSSTSTSTSSTSSTTPGVAPTQHSLGLALRRARRVSAMEAAHSSSGGYSSSSSSSSSSNHSGGVGSCVCYCPPTQGFGGCAPVASPSDCSTASVRPRGACPAIGMVLQCVSQAGGNSSKAGCAAGFDSSLGNCSTFGEQSCGGAGDGDNSNSSPFDAMRCSCLPTQFEWCGYMAAPCPANDPFFPAV